MTNYEAANEIDSNVGLWLVRLPNGGGVRAVTLEQLDDAYQRDFINGDTEVLEEGTSEWRKLRELIGEDEAPAPPPVPVSYGTTAVPTSQVRHTQQVPPAYAHPPIPPAAPMNVRAAYPGQSYPAPAAAMSPARSPAPPPVPFQPNSTAPVASNIYDLDLDLSGSPFKRKSRRGLFVVAALVVAGGVGAAVVSSQSSSVATASPESTKAQVVLPVAAKALPPEPEVVEKPKPAVESRLSEDTKKALADADKKREKTKGAKRAAKGKVASAGKRARSGERSVFTKGGDSHDPLNGSL